MFLFTGNTVSVNQGLKSVGFLLSSISQNHLKMVACLPELQPHYDWTGEQHPQRAAAAPVDLPEIFTTLSSSPRSLSVFSSSCLCLSLTQHLLLSLSISWGTEFHRCCFLSHPGNESLAFHYLLFCGLYFGFHSAKSPIVYYHVLTISCRFNESAGSVWLGELLLYYQHWDTVRLPVVTLCNKRLLTCVYNTLNWVF